MLAGAGFHWMITRFSREVIYNNGISFGWVANKWIVAGAWIVLGLWLEKRRSAGWYLVAIGGGINLVDRFRLGAVRDYWKLPVIGVYNNINDWLIFAGIILLIWNLAQKELR